MLRYKIKLTLSILGVIVFTVAAVLSVCLSETSKLILSLICGLAAFVDSFVFMIPNIFSYQAIKSSYFDPNRYCYDRKTFVDRKSIFKNIKNQIKSLDRTNENTIWIKICGTDGIGKKALVSKIFSKFWYPFNKFFFINKSVSSFNIFENLMDKYPLERELDENLYLRYMRSIKRTFIVIPFDDDQMNNSIISLMSKWMRLIDYNKNLVIITLNNKQNAKSTIKNTYVFEYEITPLTLNYSKELITKIHDEITDTDKDKISKLSEGNPALIKYLCDKYVKYPEGTFVTERLDLELRMQKDVLNAFYKLCIFTLVEKSSYPGYIVDKTTIEELILSKKIYRENNSYYVSGWLLNDLLLSEEYKNNFAEAINDLMNSHLLSDDDYLLAKAIIFKVPKDILSLLEKLSSENDFKRIKYVYLKTCFSLKNLYAPEEKKIAIFFLKALLMLGEYDMVSDFIKKIASPITPKMSKDDYDINYIIADYYHLISDYKKSNYLFESLLNVADEFGDTTKVQFSLAHNKRHNGELKEAYNMFEDLINKCKINSDIYIRSKTAQISIEYFTDEYDFDEAIKELNQLQVERNVKYNVYRHVINLKRRYNKTLDDAIKLSLNKIKELEQLNLRILYDYYFEIAECYRLKYFNGEKFFYSESLSYYNKALIFAEMNADSNLRLNAIIGKSLLEYTCSNDGKKLYKQMDNLLNEGKKISSLIYGSILVIMEVLNKAKDCEFLKNDKFKYYYKIFKSNDIKSFCLTVM